MNGSYDILLVVLSVLIAIFASYTALDLANSVTVARGRAWLGWLAAGALAMGTGIWSMHFVGMLAFEMPGMPIAYDIPLLALSVAVAIIASAAALLAVSRRALTLTTLVLAALAMGAAIAGMHYIGMWSMRMSATIDWNRGLVAASILIAVAASFVALWLAFRYRLDRSARAGWIRRGGAVLMGFAISGMHYTAMAAAWFVPLTGATPIGERQVLATDGLAVLVTATTVGILAVAIAGSAVGRELARRTAASEENARLYRTAEAARAEAELLAEQLQSQTERLGRQAGQLEALNDDLSAAQGRLQGIIDSALDAVIITDAGGIILDWNRNAETIFGWTPEEAVGKSLTETIIPPQHREDHRRGVERFLATGEGPILNRRIEMTALRRDGGEFPVELAVAVVGAGKHLVCTAFVRDITERKRAEAREREWIREEAARAEAAASESRIAEIFESITDAFFALDAEWRIVHLNSGAAELSDRPRGELGGQRFWDVYPHLVGTEVNQALTQAMTERVAVSAEIPSVLHPGTWLHFHASPTSGGVAVYIRDVTERKHAEEALRAAKEQAESANRAKSEFLSRVSHELRTPLNAVLGFGQLLELEVTTEENADSVDQILRAGKHLLGLIDEVLDISRIEAGQIGFAVEPVPVARLIQESLDLVRLPASKEEITIDAGNALAADCAVLADEQRLKQVVLNLLSNAIKYSGRAAIVTISCESGGEDRQRISIRDTGPGIPADKLSRLFTPFDRLGAEATGVEGVGLGLVLSQGLIEAMGGRMGVETVEGEGSCFWVELPRASGQTVPQVVGPRKAAEIVRPAPAATVTVLVIEDNVANVRLMERIFRRRPGVRLLTAMQGSLGLQLARDHRPDLILLDLNLPDIPGDRLLQHLREAPETGEIPIVIISGDATPDQVRRLLDLGAEAYLTKPFDVQELLRLVDERLRHRRDG